MKTYDLACNVYTSVRWLFQLYNLWDMATWSKPTNGGELYDCEW